MLIVLLCFEKTYYDSVMMQYTGLALCLVRRGLGLGVVTKPSLGLLLI